MDTIFQTYGALGVSLIILFQVFDLKLAIVRLQTEIKNFDLRLSSLEKERIKNEI